MTWECGKTKALEVHIQQASSRRDISGAREAGEGREARGKLWSGRCERAKMKRVENPFA